MGIEEFQSEIDIFNEAKLNRMLYFYYCPDYFYDELYPLLKTGDSKFDSLFRESGIELSDMQMDGLVSTAYDQDNPVMMNKLIDMEADTEGAEFFYKIFNKKYSLAMDEYSKNPVVCREFLRENLDMLKEFYGGLYLHCNSLEVIKFWHRTIRDIYKEGRLSQNEMHSFVFKNVLAGRLEVALFIYRNTMGEQRYDHYSIYTSVRMIKVLEGMSKEGIKFLYYRYRGFRSSVRLVGRELPEDKLPKVCEVISEWEKDVGKT